jgi:hypothetical protein
MIHDAGSVKSYLTNAVQATLTPLQRRRRLLAQVLDQVADEERQGILRRPVPQTRRQQKVPCSGT